MPDYTSAHDGADIDAAVTNMGLLLGAGLGSVTITSGTMNGVVIGGTTPAAASVTTLDATGASNLADITVAVTDPSDFGLTVQRSSASGRSQLRLTDELGSGVWRYGMTSGGGADFAIHSEIAGANALVLDATTLNAAFGGQITTTGVLTITRSNSSQESAQLGYEAGKVTLTARNNVNTEPAPIHFRQETTGADFTPLILDANQNATFAGDVTVVGALSKGSGSFRIDHPLKPETHQLVHSFTESPQADLLYSGTVELENGEAEINLDEFHGMMEGTFSALCRNIRTFTNNETDWANVRGSVSGNILTIECQDASCTDTVSWLVIGERQDQHMYDTDWTDSDGRVIIEPEKTEIVEPESPVVLSSDPSE